MKRVYLAGPDVFHPDAKAWGERLKGMCRGQALDATFPLDAGAEGAEAIYLACIEGIDSSDGVVANISPFRGPHMDPGTAFEIGYAIAQGKPVFGWSLNCRELKSRIPNTVDSKDGLRRDNCDRLVEDFELAENLMITVPLKSLHATPEGAIAAAAEHFRKVA